MKHYGGQRVSQNLEHLNIPSFRDIGNWFPRNHTKIKPKSMLATIFLKKTLV